MGKKRKNMLRSSMIMLIVAVLSLSSATFAWFTTGDTATVKDIEFTAQTSSGIQVSADAVSWKSEVTTTDITSAQTTALSGKLASLSSAGGVTSGALDIFKGTVTNGKLSAAAASEASATDDGYYKFDLYFKNDGDKAKTLSLDLSGCTVAGKKDSDKGTQNAVRIAAINQGVGTGDTQTVASVKAAAAGSKVTIWEPNAATHTTYATTYRYVVGSTDGKATADLVAASTAYPYVALKAAVESNDSLDVVKGAIEPKSNVAVIMTDNTGSTDTSVLYQDTTGEIEIAELAANKITKVTFYIWIEGQDVDCDNAVSAGTVVTNLKLKAEEKAADPA